MLDLGSLPLPLAIGTGLGLALAAVERVFGVLGAVVVALHAVLALALAVLLVNQRRAS